MARKRMIDPNYWVDEKLGRCQRESRFTFMGCISQADDEGRLQGHPALLKSLLFPYDTDITHEDVSAWLQQLDDEHLIIRYEVDGQSYIQIPNFSKHQTINKKTDSKLPPLTKYKDYGSTTVEDSEQLSKGVAQEKGREEKGNEEEGKRREDLFPPPDPEQIKNQIFDLVRKCKIEKYTLHSLDVLYSYIDLVDIEIIEAAIKKGENKHANYVTNTLDGMYKEGITKKEQLYQKPQKGKMREPMRDKLPDYIKNPPTEDRPISDPKKIAELEQKLKELDEWDEPKAGEG